ncbi:hypothetical protein BaRGS_00016866 [Batillaria attramentaria]|uniref:Uncharacterized protein n=1 Tax=Batillaria attramentaria TaxID=370345 RepID=A0ABD0KYH2_9CAEN
MNRNRTGSPQTQISNKPAGGSSQRWQNKTQNRTKTERVANCEENALATIHYATADLNFFLMHTLGCLMTGHFARRVGLRILCQYPRLIDTEQLYGAIHERWKNAALCHRPSFSIPPTPVNDEVYSVSGQRLMRNACEEHSSASGASCGLSITMKTDTM